MELVWISYGNIASSIFHSDCTWFYRFIDVLELVLVMMTMMVWRAHHRLSFHFRNARSTRKSLCFSHFSQWTCNNNFQLNAKPPPSSKHSSNSNSRAEKGKVKHRSKVQNSACNSFSFGNICSCLHVNAFHATTKKTHINDDFIRSITVWNVIQSKPIEEKREEKTAQ